MYVGINGRTYTTLYNDLSFDPQADITGSEVVINQFGVTIKTTDVIEIGQDAYLYDDNDQIWARYWITDADKYDEYSWRIVARSHVLLLDRRKMPAKMYASVGVSTAIAEVMGDIAYRLDSSVTGTITGFAPEQSARERLQWICFCVGAYVKSFFNDRIEILDVSETLTAIPAEKTFWQPQVSYDDYVSAIRVRLYSYRQGTPETTDTYVTPDGQTYYIETTQDVTIHNPNVPVSVPENVIEFTDVKLVNSTNASEIASRLSTYFFMRMELDADVINNAEYMPAQKYAVLIDDNHFIEGYMKSADFSFGVQARSKIKLAQARTIDAVSVILRYLWDVKQLFTQTFYLPKNYGYDIETQYLEYSEDGHRYVFYPLVDNVTGDTGTEGSVEEIQNLPALDLYEGVLMLYNVDEVDGEEIVKIG